MGKTLILAIDELAPNQVQAFATVNDALAAMEAAQNSTIQLDMSDTDNYTVAELDFVRYWVFEAFGHIEDFEMILPSTVNTNATDRVVTVKNTEAYYITVTTDDPSDVVLVPPFTNAIVQVIGGAVSLVARGGVPPSENEVYEVDMSGGDFAVDGDTFAFYQVYRASGNIAEDALGFPGDRRRIVTVLNDGNFDLIVDSGNPESTVRIPAGQKRRILIEIDIVTDLNTSPQHTVFDIFQKAAPTNAEELGRYTFTETALFLPNFLTFGVGTVTFTAQPDDTDTIIISDGVKSKTFEFDSGGGVTGGNATVTIGASFDATGTALALAINAADINVVAWYDTGTNVCTIRNLNGAGGSITDTSASPDFSTTTFVGGLDGARGSIGTLATLNTFLLIKKTVGGTVTEVGTLRIDPLGGFCFRSGTRETGNVLFNAQPDDGDTLTLFDGFVTIIYEFDSNATVTAGNISVLIGANFNATAATLVGLIMAGPLNIEAVYATPNLSLKNGNCTGGSITKVDGDNDYTVTNFSGGVAASTLTFSPGHVLSLVNQAIADATAAKIAATFMGR